MPSLWNESHRRRLVDRLARIRPDARARWGKFSAPQMLAHVNDAVRMSSGALVTTPKRTPLLRLPVVKHFVIYAMPWPKGVPTAAELLSRGDLAKWEEECAAFPGVLEAFADPHRDPRTAVHPAFGRLGRRAWGFLAYRHIDHHFRQFGG